MDIHNSNNAHFRSVYSGDVFDGRYI